MRKKYLSVLLVFFIMIFVVRNGFCQDVLLEYKNNPFRSMVNNFGNNFHHILSTPSRMSKNDALKIASYAAINIALIYNLDGEADEEIAFDEPHSFLTVVDGLADVGDLYNQIGPGIVMAGLAGAMLTGGLIFKDKKHLETARLLIESSTITSMITYTSKGLFSRLRPYTNEGPHNFNIFKFSFNSRSRAFPSGHTSHIFAMMTVIAKQYNKWWIKIPAYTLATSVAMQRMDDRRHWGSDVFMGGLLGYWVSSTLVNRNKKTADKISIQPYSSKYGFGLSASF